MATNSFLLFILMYAFYSQIVTVAVNIERECNCAIDIIIMRRFMDKVTQKCIDISAIVAV